MELLNVFRKYILCASRILLFFFCYRNNIAMAIEKYLYDCATRWATYLFLAESCAKIIASGVSCFEKASECFMQTKPSLLQKTSSVGNVILSLCLSRSMADLPFSVFNLLGYQSHWFTAEFVNVSSYLLKVDYHDQ